MTVNLKITLDISDRFATLWENHMASLSDFLDKLNAIEAAVTAHQQADAATVAAMQKEIDDLKAQLAQGGLTPAEEDQVMAKIDELQSMLPAS